MAPFFWWLRLGPTLSPFGPLLIVADPREDLSQALVVVHGGLADALQLAKSGAGYGGTVDIQSTASALVDSLTVAGVARC